MRAMALVVIASLWSASAAVAQQTGGHGFFIENKGQWDSRARFLLQTRGLDTWITDGGVTYDLYRAEMVRDAAVSVVTTELADETVAPDRAVRRAGHVVNVTFEDARGSVRGTHRLPGYVNYFTGRDRSRWATNVGRFSEARIDELYPGVDALFYLEDGRPRYDLVVSPMADASRIRMRIGDVEAVEISRSGALQIHTSVGVLEQSGLYAYQRVNGMRRPVACDFLLRNDGSIGFKLGDYDSSQPLVIDPLVYATYIGGSWSESGLSVALDEADNIYVAGITDSPEFPLSGGAYDSTTNGEYDLFLTSFAADAKTLVYSTYIGGSSNDQVKFVTVDASGDVWMTGLTTSSDFPVSESTFQNYLAGGDDAFIVRLGSGGDLEYSTYLGGTSTDNADVVRVDGAGNFYVVGLTTSADFPVSSGAFDDTWGGMGDGFLAMFEPSGAAFIYSTYFGSSGGEGIRGLALDFAGNMYLTGGTESTDLPVTENAFCDTMSGVRDAFVVKFRAEEFTLDYCTYLGGTALDVGWKIEVDAQGNAYVTGQSASTDFPTTANAFGDTCSGGADVFVSALVPDGSGLLFSTLAGGLADEIPKDIAIDAQGNALVVGYTLSDSYPTSDEAHSRTLGGTSDAFITSVCPDGCTLAYSSYLGSPSEDIAYAVELDSKGRAVIAGSTGSGGFPVTADAFDTSTNGMTDVFLAVLDDRVNGVEAEAVIAEGTSLDSRCAPNPSSGELRIEYRLLTQAHVVVRLHDVVGRTVAILAEGERPAGRHVEPWDGRDAKGARLPPGVYYYTIQAQRLAERGRVVLMR